jgi:secreted trypsin-like serine protease
MNFLFYFWDQLKFFFSYLSLIIYKQPCPIGYVGDNCEIECGVGFTNVYNPKIVGGNASAANAWPSHVFFDFSYKGYVYLNDLNQYTFVNVSYSYLCGGSLIDRNTILTASHCIVSSIPIKFNSSRYTLSVKPNDPKAIYSVYLGVHNLSLIAANYSNRIQVKQVVMVSFE